MDDDELHGFRLYAKIFKAFLKPKKQSLDCRMANVHSTFTLEQFLSQPRILWGNLEKQHQGCIGLPREKREAANLADSSRAVFTAFTAGSC